MLLAFVVNCGGHKGAKTMTATNAIIPVSLFRAPISMTAKIAWIEVSLDSSIKRPDVIIDPHKLAVALGRSVSTIRRALRELIDAGLLRFKVWVCKKFKVFTLIWNKCAGGEKARPKKDVVEKKVVVEQKAEVVETAAKFIENKPIAPPRAGELRPRPQVDLMESSESSFMNDNNGELYVKEEEVDEIRIVANQLTAIGFTQKGAIEILCRKKPEGCRQLLKELEFIES